ncbi:MAG: hypothetical protein Q4E33_04200 [Erysipelotrichaceae bacterium]|nr:hypothetical protein [Erysipelotrichaceae bacterium]
MKEKYAKCGLNFDLIIKKYPNIYEYEEIVNAYLDDEFFVSIEGMLKDEDYALAKDATKGLYILASELLLFPLYESLLELYEDLEYETYDDCIKHFEIVKDKHQLIRGLFNV